MPWQFKDVLSSTRQSRLKIFSHPHGPFLRGNELDVNILLVGSGSILVAHSDDEAVTKEEFFAGSMHPPVIVSLICPIYDLHLYL